MTQQYFVSVRAMGPYNANKSTKELCSIVTRKLDNTTVQSDAAISKVQRYVTTLCSDINAKNMRNKPLKTESIWRTGSKHGTCSAHFCVKIDSFNNGDGSFLQLSFSPIRHAYKDGNVMEDLFGVSDYVTTHKNDKKPSFRRWNPDKASNGDIICDDEHDEVIIFRSIRSNYIVYAAVYSAGDGFFNVQYNDTLTYGYVGHKTFHYATMEEKGILFNELSIRGLRWNEDTLSIENIEE